MIKNEILYTLALSVLPNSLIRESLKYINDYSAQEIFIKLDLFKRGKVVAHIANKYSGTPLEVAEKIFNKCKENKIKILNIYSKKYPQILKQIPDPPIILYVIGNPDFENCIAIVGTRKSDNLSDNVTQKLSVELAAAGFTIVSGLALGVDRNAHLAVLKNRCATIAVLANGIDKISPITNKDLYNKILLSNNSALISEYPPQIYADKWTFVRRNRIISGLSEGTIVVKAPEKSGSLITAKYAIEQNREVFACPGNTFNNEYGGCHKLIKEGAVLVSDTIDILNEFGMHKISCKDQTKQMPIIEAEDDKEHNKINNNACIYKEETYQYKVITEINNGTNSIDSIINKLQIETSKMNEVIIEMELDNIIKRSGHILELV